MSRNYRKEYDNYHSKPEQKIRRAARNAARARFKNADPDKDVHHKDNNPLNNDKKNLSLVTKHYNRREPRLRGEDIASRAKEVSALKLRHRDEIEKERESKARKRTAKNRERTAARNEAALVVSNEVSAVEAIVGKFEKLLKQSNFKKKQKLAQAVGIKISMRGKNRVQVEDVQSKAHDSSTLEGALPKLQGQYFRNKVAQAMQTVGRQDASGLQRKTIYKASDQMRKSTRAFQLHFDKVRDTETQGLIVKGLRQVMDKKDIFFVWDSKFAKRLTTFKEEEMGTVTGTHISGTGDDSSTVVVKKKKKKKDVHVRFKLKNQKSLKKRILDNVLAIQQKV